MNHPVIEHMTLRIVADADILSVETGFRELGELALVPGREISRDVLHQADVLLVRSITRVDAALLQGTSVRLVGTATSGTDHVDTGYLQQQGIQFCDARGSNANAVADYCYTALAQLFARRKVDPGALTFAIIGAGRVGGLFIRRLRAHGIQCVAHDPFLGESAIDSLIQIGVRMVDLETALAADVVSLHVPLTTSGPHPTYHMLGADRLELLSTGGILVNTSRGAVVSNNDLRQVLATRRDLSVVLDVWENEPAIDTGLLDRVTVATPHIAGYSIEAKLDATAMLRRQVCEFFALEADDDRAWQGPSAGSTESVMTGQAEPDDYFCGAILSRFFPIMDLDHEFRAGFGADDIDASRVFDRLRRHLVGRHEFRRCRLTTTADLSRQQQDYLRHLGFAFGPSRS